MKTLALDLGTSTGWAVQANGILSSGWMDFSRYTGCASRPADHIGSSFGRMFYWLEEKVREDKIEAIAYENVYRWNSGDAAKAYGGFRGAMMIVADHNNIPVFDYSASHIKKFWTGKGTADKEAILKVTVARYPHLRHFNVRSDEADAIAILQLHIATVSSPAASRRSADSDSPALPAAQ